ncbi:hypothetical protein FJT64_001845 [Amphibalanus amphitrite]|uniref:DUF5641 domain-containing protein n=1 Tax=Amphibalanus amphitrite TaxID=1232801 RepID=A0A6A4WZ85_AMPAM|nr:hypothetical protein FJT64_001845 [Amphibalanus amphitrite]
MTSQQTEDELRGILLIGDPRIISLPESRVLIGPSDPILIRGVDAATSLVVTSRLILADDRLVLVDDRLILDNHLNLVDDSQRRLADCTPLRLVHEAGRAGLGGLGLVVNRLLRLCMQLLPHLAVAYADQDAVRFLWRVGDRVRHMRFQRVVMGVTCSPFLLNATIRHYLARCEDSLVVTELRDSLYADDWLSGADTEADASPKAYGCSAYLRIRQHDGSFSVSFVASKGRVAPLRQQLTLPRLELLACVMAAEMVQYVLSALRLPESTRFSCWSDSMIALGWLRGRPERWKTYVANRVKVREKRLQKFWNVWSQEYVRSLPLSVRKFRSQGKLAEGAVVLLQDEKQPRLKWDLGVVTRLFPGRDGVSRSAEVRTAKGKKTRAVQRLHDLEVLPASEDA